MPHAARVLLPLVLLVTAGLAGCTTAPDADVLVTFYPLAFLTQRIAGDDVSVALLVPEGSEPHDWSPSPRDYQRIDRAELVVAQGLGFEPWLEDATASLGSGAPLVLHSAEGDVGDEEEVFAHDDAHGDAQDNGTHSENETHEEDPTTDHDEGHDGQDDHDGHDHGGTDPHTWLDPVHFAQQAARIRDALATTFPEHREAFMARADLLLHDLEGLHEEYEAALSQCDHDVVVTQHDAFGRLAHRYGFSVKSVAGLDPEAEPGAARVQQVIAFARDNDLPAVYAEAGGDARIMEVIAHEADTELLHLHTLEGRTAPDRNADRSYLDLMRENLEALRIGLGCTA